MSWLNAYADQSLAMERKRPFFIIVPSGDTTRRALNCCADLQVGWNVDLMVRVGFFAVHRRRYQPTQDETGSDPSPQPGEGGCTAFLGSKIGQNRAILRVKSGFLGQKRAKKGPLCLLFS